MQAGEELHKYLVVLSPGVLSTVEFHSYGITTRSFNVANFKGPVEVSAYFGQWLWVSNDTVPLPSDPTTIPSAAKLRARFRGKLPHQNLPRQIPPPPALQWNDYERFAAC